MSTGIIKTAIALALGIGLALSGAAVAGSGNWLTYLDQVRTSPPTEQVAASGPGVSENYVSYLEYVRQPGPQTLDEGPALVGETYETHLQAVRECLIEHGQITGAEEIAVAEAPERIDGARATC